MSVYYLDKANFGEKERVVAEHGTMRAVTFR